MANKILSKNDLKFIVNDYASSRVQPLPNEYTEFEEHIELKDGIQFRTLEPVVKKLRDRDAGLRYVDFSIDSLAFSGSLNDAQLSQLNGERLGIADALENNISNSVVENG